MRYNMKREPGATTTPGQQEKKGGDTVQTLLLIVGIVMAAKIAAETLTAIKEAAQGDSNTQGGKR